MEGLINYETELSINPSTSAKLNLHPPTHSLSQWFTATPSASGIEWAGDGEEMDLLRLLWRILLID